MARTSRKENTMLLIIHNEKRKARAINDLMYHRGILSDIAAPHEVIGSIHNACRAIVFMEPNNIPDVEDLVEKIRIYNTGVPIFSLKSATSSDFSDSIFDSIIRVDAGSSAMIYEIVSYQKKHNLPITSCYRLAGINASCQTNTVTVFDKPVKLTKTETMILRYLIAAYPGPRDTRNILHYAFKPLGKPEPTSIRTHVSLINKKFKALRNRPIIINIPGEGYVIGTPEILESIKNGELPSNSKSITV